MKILLLLATALVAPVLSYATKYDNIDLDEILHNKRLYKKYFDCLANTGRCTPDGQELKDILPEALSSQCLRCNNKQKNGAAKVMKFMIENNPEDYAVLEKMYDPEGYYRKRYYAETEKCRKT